MGALIQRPLNAAEDHLGGATAVIVQHLTDQRLLYPARYADARALNVASEYRSGAMSAVSLPITIAGPAEILLHYINPGKGGMCLVDSLVAA